MASLEIPVPPDPPEVRVRASDRCSLPLVRGIVKRPRLTEAIFGRTRWGNDPKPGRRSILVHPRTDNAVRVLDTGTAGLGPESSRTSRDRPGELALYVVELGGQALAKLALPLGVAFESFFNLFG